MKLLNLIVQMGSRQDIMTPETRKVKLGKMTPGQYGPKTLQDNTKGRCAQKCLMLQRGPKPDVKNGRCQNWDLSVKHGRCQRRDPSYTKGKNAQT